MWSAQQWNIVLSSFINWTPNHKWKDAFLLEQLSIFRSSVPESEYVESQEQHFWQAVTQQSASQHTRVLLYYNSMQNTKCVFWLSLQLRSVLISHWPLAAFSTWSSSLAKSMTSANLFSTQSTRKCIRVCLPSCVFVFTSCQYTQRRHFLQWQISQ